MSYVMEPVEHRTIMLRISLAVTCPNDSDNDIVRDDRDGIHTVTYMYNYMCVYIYI